MQQQHNHNLNQVNDANEIDRKNPQRKIRSTSHGRLRLSTNSVKTIATSKSTENGEK